MAREIINSIRGCTWFWFFSGVAIILLVISLFIPPTGVIDESVLKAVGEIFGFAALGTVLYAINRGVDARLAKGDTSIEINSPDGNN